jgi:hypothetical protein
MTEQYDDFIRELQKLPDFNRLPLPESIRERLNIPLEYSYMSIKEATTKAFDNTNEYVNAGKLEIRDQTKEKIEFPPIPEKHYMLEGIEEETMTICAGEPITNEISYDTLSLPPQESETPTEANDSKPQHSEDLSSSHPCQNDD